MIIILLMALIVIAGFAGWLGAVLDEKLPHWSTGRIALISALPAPGLLWGLYLLTRLSVPHTECAREGCGGAAEVMTMLMIGVATYTTGLFSAASVVRWVKRA